MAHIKIVDQLKFTFNVIDYLIAGIPSRSLKSAEILYMDKVSNCSKISTSSMNRILDYLPHKTTRDSTKKNYYCVWKIFNSFIVKLDKKPSSWEDRISLFGAYLVNKGMQSSTMKSYYSGIKSILRDDGYQVAATKVLFNTLVKSCKLVNDRMKTRLPIQIRLLELILFEVERSFPNQYYLEVMYKTILLLGYYGLFRIGELTYTTSEHTLSACNIHIAWNKPKMLFVLYTSKTHDIGSRPQHIRISANTDQFSKANRFFCPFKLSRQYLNLRGYYVSNMDPFFIFRDNKPVKLAHIRKVLKNSLHHLNLNPDLYNCHSSRIGRATDMIKNGEKLETVKIYGRWRSNAVYRYIRDIENITN